MNVMYEYDGPRKGPGLKEVVEMYWAKRSWCIQFRFCVKVSGEDRERLGCIELGWEYSLGV